MRLPLVVGLVAGVSVACTGAQPIECAQDSECLQGGIGGHCIAAGLAAETKAYCAFSDPACPGGLRWGVLAREDLATMCVSSDLLDAGVADGSTADAATPDAAGAPAFDVAYPDQWKFSINDRISGYLEVINTSDQAMNTATLAVKAITDNNPTGRILVVATPSSMTIFPGEAGGKLSGDSEQLFATLATEPRTDFSSDYLSMELVDFPPGTYDIEATLVVTLEDLDVTMPMTIHHVSSTGVFADPLRGKRISIFR